MKFLSTVDLTQNQIINIVLHRSATDPAGGVEGQVYYNTATDLVMYHNGTAWVSMSGDVTDVLAGNGLTRSVSGGDITLDVNVDNATLEIATDIVKIKAGGVSSTELASNAVTTIKVTDKNITFAKIQDIPTMTVIGRTTAGTGVPESVTIINDNTMATASATNLATSSSIKAYVDAKVAAIGSLKGGFDASASTNLPGDGTTLKGDYWYVTVAGTVQSQVFNVGDLIIANQAAPTVTNANHYIFLESNRDQASTTLLGLVRLATTAEAQALTHATAVLTPAALATITATETRKGIAEIATSAEVTTGTDDTTIVTPLKLKTLLDSRVGGYAADVGNASASSFTLTHNLNTLDVSIDVYEKATGNKVYCDCTAASVNTVTVSFTTAPALNAYRVVIKK